MQRPDIMMSRSIMRNKLWESFILLLAYRKQEKVDELTQQLEADGYVIAGFPRLTGDGYYESVVLDPEKIL